MLCENCKQREATVHVSEVLNGQKTEHYLCDHCVKMSKNNINPEGILFNNFISELMKIALEEGYLKSPKSPTQKTCACCGLSLKEFLEIGRFGCKTCYSTFDTELKNAFVNVHGNTKHVGKTIVSPKPEELTEDGAESIKTREKQLAELQDALQKAIEGEAYEQAAELRDQIRALKKEGSL